MKYLWLAFLVLSAFGCSDSGFPVPVEFEITGQEPIDKHSIRDTVYTARLAADLLEIEGMFCASPCDSLSATASQRNSYFRVIVSLHIEARSPDRCGWQDRQHFYEASIRYVRPVFPSGPREWELHVRHLVIRSRPRLDPLAAGQLGGSRRASPSRTARSCSPVLTAARR
jgi:hypothetical protein